MNKKAFTLTEAVIAISLFIILVLGAYRLFSSEVKSLKTALEHIGVNESARRLFAQLGSDVRNSNQVLFPPQIEREKVLSLSPVSEGRVLLLCRQVFDFNIKPPDSKLIREELIEYYLKKNNNGSSDLMRKISTESSKGAERKICDGIYDMLTFITGRKPVSVKSGSALLPLKSSIQYEPYNSDGTGPYLVHVKTSFIRADSKKNSTSEPVFSVFTSFALRGRLNAIHP